MTLTRWTPRRDFLGIAEDMNRLVKSMFDDDASEASFLKGNWTPAVDISEDDNNFYLNVDLPGMTKDQVKVRFEDGMLSITGEKKSEKEEKKVNYHRVERSFGRFERSFRVPSRISANKIDAKFDKGVLTVTMPKAEEAKPKEIEVKIN
ncbi:MAG: Hsp20/alpha crystallin family protein [Deferribacteres bacterium]|nr:Hsp20/alpha crystallin family protein [candidate division KSB1 bacterium]MCB9509714.1 Hsp20/alpha crystallin family protein [Deferribacteres bacterium]